MQPGTWSSLDLRSHRVIFKTVARLVPEAREHELGGPGTALGGDTGLAGHKAILVGIYQRPRGPTRIQEMSRIMDTRLERTVNGGGR